MNIDKFVEGHDIDIFLFYVTSIMKNGKLQKTMDYIQYKIHPGKGSHLPKLLSKNHLT